MAYLAAHPETARGAVGGLNLDMVGEDLAKTGSVLSIVQTPWSAPSYLNDLVPAVAAWIRDAGIEEATGSSWPLAYRVRTYSSGSDHEMLNDPTIGVPTAGAEDAAHRGELVWVGATARLASLAAAGVAAPPDRDQAMRARRLALAVEL